MAPGSWRASQTEYRQPADPVESKEGQFKAMSKRQEIVYRTGVRHEAALGRAAPFRHARSRGQGKYHGEEVARRHDSQSCGAHHVFECVHAIAPLMLEESVVSGKERRKG